MITASLTQKARRNRLSALTALAEVHAPSKARARSPRISVISPIFISSRQIASIAKAAANAPQPWTGPHAPAASLPIAA